MYKRQIPGCTYTSPEVASVGLSEAKAAEAGYELKIGKFPFTASGKASAAGANDGFIKLIFNAKDHTPVSYTHLSYKGGGSSSQTAALGVDFPDNHTGFDFTTG